MSITDLKLTEKVKVFLRLIENNENIKDACSKAGIKVSSKTINNSLI